MNNNAKQLELIRSSIKSINNYPREGIIFRDITSLIEKADVFQLTIDLLLEKISSYPVTKIVATESRGFIFGAPIALTLKVPLILVRKKGKLPRKVISEEYDLEYGTDILELHVDSIQKHDNVVIIDDLLATGGTVIATSNLVKRLGGNVVLSAFVIGLPDLHGAEKLQQNKMESFTLVNFTGH